MVRRKNGSPDKRSFILAKRRRGWNLSAFGRSLAVRTGALLDDVVEEHYQEFHFAASFPPGVRNICLVTGDSAGKEEARQKRFRWHLVFGERQRSWNFPAARPALAVRASTLLNNVIHEQD